MNTKDYYEKINVIKRKYANGNKQECVWTTATHLDISNEKGWKGLTLWTWSDFKNERFNAKTFNFYPLIFVCFYTGVYPLQELER